MTLTPHRIWCALATALGVWTLGATQARAVDVAPADLEAAVRTLGFVETLQRHSPITVGVVYRSGDAESRTMAQRAAAILAATHGPDASTIVAVPVAAGELGQGGRHLDVIYVLPGASDSGRSVADFVRQQHVVSISSDPACLNAQCCVLLVQAGARTEIVLDTAVAQEAGAKFSSVFMMMVKRR